METSLSTEIIMSLFGISHRYDSKEQFLNSAKAQDGWSVKPNINESSGRKPIISISVESPFGSFSLYYDDYDEYFILNDIHPY